MYIEEGLVFFLFYIDFNCFLYLNTTIESMFLISIDVDAESNIQFKLIL